MIYLAHFSIYLGSWISISSLLFLLWGLGEVVIRIQRIWIQPQLVGVDKFEEGSEEEQADGGDEEQDGQQERPN